MHLFESRHLYELCFNLDKYVIYIIHILFRCSWTSKQRNPENLLPEGPTLSVVAEQVRVLPRA